ncbi:MAG: recombinase family protein [Micropepsaceae bacterium]
MPDYVAYYRVSTDRQGASGLGLDAQRQAVASFLGPQCRPVADFIEVESGRRDTNRPQLHAALAECRRRGATLLIARLDRLARNVAFIANLMESRTEFVAVDMPQANAFMLHIHAAVAEYERELISKRTKAALDQVKADLAANGSRVSRAGRVYSKLGNPKPLEALRAANAAKAHFVPSPEVLALIEGWTRQRKGLREIARELNRLNIRTPRGGLWYAQSVSRVLGARQNQPA